MTKKIRNFTVYNDVRIELSNEGIKVIYRDTIKMLREIMDRLGILYGKWKPSEFEPSPYFPYNWQLQLFKGCRFLR